MTRKMSDENKKLKNKSTNIANKKSIQKIKSLGDALKANILRRKKLKEPKDEQE